MPEKIKVAFIYKKSNIFLTGNHFDNTYYHFLMQALKRNKEIEVTYFPTDEYFNVTVLKDKFDIIQLWQNNEFGMPKEIDGIEDLDIPVISMVSDVREAKDSIRFHKKWKIDYYFNFMHESYFYKFYPRSYNYKTIIWGLEPSLYQNLKPWRERLNKILNSGATGKSNLVSRVANAILNPRRSGWYFYKLRTMCNDLQYIEHTKMIGKSYGDNYAAHLSRYKGAIAATTFYPTVKYLEVPAAGCLTFMEITQKNRGEYLGYKDGHSSIFINEKNYQKKFCEFLDDPENPRWEEIANNGRKHALENLSNDKAVEALVELIQTLIK